MAFPSDTGTQAETQSEGFANARKLAAQIKSRSNYVVSQSLAGPISALIVLQYLDTAIMTRNRNLQIAAIPNIGAYAQAQLSSPGFDIAAEFTTMNNAINAVIAWIVANYPKASGYLQSEQFDANGNRVYRQFATADLAGLRTVLNTLISTIN